MQEKEEKREKTEQEKTKQRKDFQEKYLEFQQLKEQIQNLNENVNHLANQAENIVLTIKNLEEFSALEKNTEILVPVSNGIFIKANLTDNKEFLVNLGAGAVVSKDLEGIKQLMAQQRKEVINVQMSLISELEAYKARAQELQRELENMLT